MYPITRLIAKTNHPNRKSLVFFFILIACISYGLDSIKDYGGLIFILRINFRVVLVRTQAIRIVPGPPWLLPLTALIREIGDYL